MIRPLIALFAVLAVTAPGQDVTDPPPPSVEAMLTRARNEATARRQWLKQRVDALLTKLKNNEGLGDSVDLQARADLHELGSAAVPILVARFGVEEGPQTMWEIGFAIGTIMKEPDPAVVEAIRGHLGGDSVVRALFAVKLLGYIGDAAAVADLLPIAKNSADDALRAAAITAVSRIDPKGASGDISRSALRTGGPVVRAAAIRALGLRADPADLEVVLKSLEDPDENVVIAVAESLPSWGDRTTRSLHPILSHSSDRVVDAALDSLAKVGTKETSGRHLKALVTNDERDYDLRKHAAKVMFDLGDRAGLKELAEPYKKQISKRPRSRSLPRELGKLYWEFRDYKNAVSYLGKSLDEQDDPESRAINETMARCYARLRLFKKAKEHLSKSGRSMFWADLGDDPDFAEMRKDRKWAKYFDS